MKRIAFILQKLTGGGAERTVANLSFALSGKYEVYIILFDGTQVNYPHQGTILSLDAPSRPTAVGKALNGLKRIGNLKKLKKEYHFDVVISFMFGANIINVLSRQNEKIITSARNYMSAYGLTRLRLLQERFTGNKADKIVAISEMVRQDLIRNFTLPADKILTIYNPCDANRIREYAVAEPDFVFQQGAFYFITAGRLVRQKGQWDLLKAFSIVAAKKENAKLIVLGAGPLEAKLKELAERLGIRSKVHFLGFQDNPYAFMKRADAFVLTSLHEGLGNVVLEAMACGLPVLSTDCYAGPREILAPESDLFAKASDVERRSCGVLVPEISKEEDFGTTLNEKHEMLSNALTELMDNKELREKYSAAGVSRLADFSPDFIAKQWDCVISMIGK